MRTIFKYPLNVTDTQELWLPKGSQILDVQRQDTKIMLWAEIDPHAISEVHTIEFHGTGNPIEKGERKYIATVQHYGLVWHVYERL